jgi:hypothetical protein
MASIKGDEKVLLERHLGQGPTYISMGQSEVVLLGTHWELEEHGDPELAIIDQNRFVSTC